MILAEPKLVGREKELDELQRRLDLAIEGKGMHPAEETQAVLDLFDGEISIYEKETPKGSAMFLKVKKMTGQKYSKEETPITLV